VKRFMFYFAVILLALALTEGPDTFSALLGAGILIWLFEDRIFGKED
jgi:Sec-independent protein secretion pathway component TatC